METNFRLWMILIFMIALSVVEYRLMFILNDILTEQKNFNRIIKELNPKLDKVNNYMDDIALGLRTKEFKNTKKLPNKKGV